MTRFLRDFELIIGLGSEAVTVTPPIRISFSAEKTTKISLNKLDVKIYNLKESTRLQLIKDEEDKKYIPIKLLAGYLDRKELIFKGNVHVGEHSREGAEFVSTLQALDGGVDFLQSFTSATVTTKAAAIDAALGTMGNTARGSITQINDLIRPKVLVGNSARLITDMLADDEAFFIDNEQANIIKNDEVRSGLTPVVSASTGLINTPSSQKGIVTLQTMLNPDIKIAGLISLESVTAPDLDGIYRVETITYSGDYAGNEWAQTVTAKRAGSYKVVR
jgi:hypothetical protein